MKSLSGYFRLLKITILSYINDDCYFKAASLSFYTLSSIVPMFAVAFGIAKGFGLEEFLENQIMNSFYQQREVFAYILKFAKAMIANTKGNVIAGVGVAVLFYTTLSMLENIESVLNEIWKIKVGRNYFEKIKDYLTAMILFPIFFITYSSLNIYLAGMVSEQKNWIFQYFGPLLATLLTLAPLALSWIIFSSLYIFGPNTKVVLGSRIFAGVLTGTLFQIWQWIYISFQVKISSYGAIYGTLAALPLFLIWLQVSWLIALFGAELAARIENDFFYENKKRHKKLVKIEMDEIGLLIFYHLVKAHYNGEGPQRIKDISHELGISFPVVSEMVTFFEEKELIGEVEVYGKNRGYQPLKDAKNYHIEDILKTIHEYNSISDEAFDTEDFKKIKLAIVKIGQKAYESRTNMDFAELVSLNYSQ